jgi:hypothetical protein
MRAASSRWTVQMRTNVPHIFAIGDLVGQPMLAHKAVHEAHVAAEVIAAGDTRPIRLRRPVIPGVAYTDPEVAWVGLTEDEAKAQGVKVGSASSPGPPPAAPSPTAATKASPSWCSTPARPIASSAAASSAPTPAT